MLHSVVVFSWSPPICDLDLSKEVWSVILWNIPQFEFDWYLHWGQASGEGYHRSDTVFSLEHVIRGFMTCTCIITGVVDLHHLDEVVWVGCLHYKCTTFPFVISIFGEILWDFANILFLLNLSPTNFGTINGSRMQQLLWYLPNGDFLFPSLPFYLLIKILL